MAMSKTGDFGNDKSPKRKREAEETAPSKRSQKRKRASAHPEDEDIDEERGINLALARMNPDLLADYIARKTKRFAKEATLVELEARRVPVHAFTDTTEWTEARILDQLPSFLEHFSDGAEELCQAPEETGSPHTLVVTATGLRAADLTRSLRKFQTKDVLIAKLFAKHFKLSEQVDVLEKKRVSIGVGTPTRLVDLLDSGALKIDKLKRIVVDLSHVDQKRRGMLGMAEAQKPLIDLINRPEIKNRYGPVAAKIDLLFF